MHYVTPPVRPGSTVQQRSIVWGPGVVAAVVALLAVLSCMGWLILNWVTRPPSTTVALMVGVRVTGSGSGGLFVGGGVAIWSG